jgi:hypothetical protein
MFRMISMRTLTSAFGRQASVLTVIVAVAFLSACSGKKVVIGTNGEVRYSGTATKQEAEALGAALKASGYFQDHGAGVILSKGGEGTVISFVVKEGFWEDPKNVEGFEQLGRAVGPTVGGVPIKVRLVNTAAEMKKEIPVS